MFDERVLVRVLGDAPDHHGVVRQRHHGVVVLFHVRVLASFQMRDHDEEAQDREYVQTRDDEHHQTHVPALHGLILRRRRDDARRDARQHFHGVLVHVRVLVVVQVHGVVNHKRHERRHEEEVQREALERAEPQTDARSERFQILVPGTAHRDVLPVDVRHGGSLPLRLGLVEVELGVDVGQAIGHELLELGSRRRRRRRRRRRDRSVDGRR
mmetsp:Transcript_13494/g.57590  ORF Transcript_13494/g.57590 Transcript_13494/m.57590 type:complete len:212 (+) Transcript_13494:3248-3883(+)